jgi:TonB-dependent starch-binding outer membrane protein SusC
MFRQVHTKLLTALAMFWCTALAAQDISVKGRVITTDDGSGLPNATIQVKGTSTGVYTDLEGMFKITAPSNGVLIINYTGYNNMEVPIDGRTTIDIALEPSLSLINEVVVTGYGTSLNKKEATGATSNLKGTVIENLPLQSFDRAMQGRMSGVQISSANGVPGGAVAVRIRGVGSISGGNEPLFVVDGVQLNTRNDGGTIVNNNPLAYLNPNDIESIDVLKDPATAAIYGAQAANGVVIITTKKGKSGRTSVNFNAYYGSTELVNSVDVLNTQDFIAARIEARRNNAPATPLATHRSATLAELGFAADLTDEGIAALPTYDWLGAVYQRGQLSNYDISVQGGNDKTSFYFSGAYTQQDAALINIDFERFASKLNITHKLSSKVSLEAGINASSITQRGPYGDASGTTAFGAPQYSGPLILPFNPIFDERGDYYGLPASGINIVGDLSQNILAVSEYNKGIGKVKQLVGSAALNINLTKDLVLRGLVGMDYRNLRATEFGDPRLPDNFATRGDISEFTNENSNLTTNVTLNYNKTLNEKHSIGVLLGTEYRDEVNEAVSLSATGFPTPDFNTANAAAEPLGIGGFWTGVKRAGVFSNLRYDFDKRYIVSAVFRYDGSSRFGADNRWGFFPAISAKWNIANENFLVDSKIISDLGLRVSYGATGNDRVGADFTAPSNFAARRLYGLNGVYQGNSGIRPTQVDNPALRWERNVTLNLGLDYGFFDGRVRGAVDVFRRVSSDLLLERSIPQSNGLANTNTSPNDFITENIGEVVNEGIEFEITTLNLRRGRLKWETNFNITALRNEVTKLFEGADVLPGNLSVRVGYPLFTNVAVPYAGVNPANGRPMFYDLNGNITYLVRAADQRPLGHANLSTLYGGLTNTFSAYGVELSGLLQFDYGRTAPNFQEFRLADNGAVLRNSLQQYWDNRWTAPGQITDVPKPANNRTEITGRVASYQQIGRFYQDASFIRLKQVTLAYNLPGNWLRKVRMTNLKLYIQSVNPLTWTKWTGFDPEFLSLTTGIGNQGIVPTAKTYTFGIQAGF